MIKNIIIRVFCYCLLIYLVFNNRQGKAQSSLYTIESFQSTYTELATYESIALLTEGDLLWEYEFDLDFPFPFYDSTYTRLFYNHSAWGYFTENQDVALLLMDFSGTYTFDNLLDTNNITSDVRFSHVELDNMKAFVIQFTNNRFFADPYEDNHDTYLNFQIWLYENGVIEVHFGEMHMDNNPIYAPGKGFYGYTSSGGIDTTDIGGPHMGISHPITEADEIGLEGAYNDYKVIGSNYAIMTDLPPQGWIIRFKPTSVGNNDLRYENDFIISPNPTSSLLQINHPYDIVFIYDTSGCILYEGLSDELLDVSFLPNGMYFLQVISSGKILTSKFIKQ